MGASETEDGVRSIEAIIKELMPVLGFDPVREVPIINLGQYKTNKINLIFTDTIGEKVTSLVFISRCVCGNQE